MPLELCAKGEGGKPCGRFQKTLRLQRGDCPRCWAHSKHSKAVRAISSEVAKRITLPCVHVGKPAPPPAGHDVRKTYYECEAGKGVVCQCNCGSACDRYVPESGTDAPIHEIAPVSVATVREGLVDGPAHARINSSIFRYQGKLLLCYRTGWAGARLHISQLNAAFKPIGRQHTLLNLSTPRSSYGQEDPRLFVFRNRLHVSFTGVESVNGQIKTNVLYARLTDDYRTEEVFYPDYKARTPWEKNWAFWEWENELFCTYKISPHVVLHVSGTSVYPFTSSPNPHPWHGGHLRGGASPLRIGDKFYHFFHGRGGVSDYSVGVNTFEARPPFRILSQTAMPILQSDPKTKPPDQYIPVVFPCGAILENGQWHVSMGVHDRTTEIASFREEDIETALGHRKPVPVTGKVILTSIFTQGANPFGVMYDANKDRKPIGDLTESEWRQWLRPLVANAERWGRVVVLYDELPAFVRAMESDRLRFVRVKPSGGIGSYERRWFAWRDYLEANPGIEWAWFVDAGDVLFMDDPFANDWSLTVGTDEVPYGSCVWQADHLGRLSPDVRETLVVKHAAEMPYNAGTWGGNRHCARQVLRDVCHEIASMEERLVVSGDGRPTVVDMAAFGVVMAEKYASMAILFPRKGGKPLYHDRRLCEDVLGSSPV